MDKGANPNGPMPCAQRGPSSQLAAFSPQAFLTVAAFACYWGWLFCCYWSNAFNAVFGPSEVSQMLYRGVGMVGQAVVLGVIIVSWRFFSRERGLRALTIIGVTGSPLGALPALLDAWGVSLPPVLIVACLFVFGCGHACLFVKIGLLLDERSGSTLAPVIGSGILIAGLLYLAIVNMASVAQPVVLMALPWVVAITAYFARSRQNLADVDLASMSLDECGDDGIRGVFRRFLLMLLFYSAAFAATQLLAVIMTGWSSDSNSFWIAIVLPGLFMLLLSVRYIGAGRDASAVLRVLPLVMALGLVLLPFTDGPAQTACYFMIAFGFTAFDMLSLYQLSRLIKRNNLSVVRYFALGRFANGFGMACGWTVCTVLVAWVGTGNEVVTYVSIGFVLLLIVLLLFSGGLFDPAASASATGGDGRRPWRQCCEELCAEYGLSPRESEVFELLARGRDNHHICEVLYISPATVKTHTYNIYRKLNVHSQQELISIVEGRFRP